MCIETIAIVIGVSYYLQDDIPSLPAAEIDAVNFARALRNWGISEENILLLLNQDANVKLVDNFFTKLTEKKEPYKLLFYFCGHGCRSLNKTPKSYLIFYDSYLKSNDCFNSFNLDFFIERISKMNVLESYIFIDACCLRINTFINPKLEEKIRGKSISHKSLFCLLSSGIEESFENINEKYGYFTRALINSLCRVRKSEGSPTQFLHDIQNEMIEEDLPLPDMVNFGNQKISFLPEIDFLIDNHGKIYRSKFISEIQDVFIQRQNKIISLFGEEGSGKTTICEWLASEKMKTLHLIIPFGENEFFDPIFFLEKRIYENFGCAFNEFDALYPFYLVIIDQLERLSTQQLKLLLKWMQDSANLRFLCTFRQPSKHPINELFGDAFFNLKLPPLSLKEGKLFIQKINPTHSEQEIELIYLLTQGNPLKIKKISPINVDMDFAELTELEKAIAAIYSCGACYDKILFERIFNLLEGILDFFEKVGLILPLEQGFIPHPILNEFAESKDLIVDPQTILTYWSQQALALPSHSEIAKSLILAIKCFGYEKKIKKILKKAFQTLSVNKENLNYFIDGAEIFLSISYRTAITVYLAKVLKKWGKVELSNKLLSKRRSPMKWSSSLIHLSFLIILSLCSIFWLQSSSAKLIYVKQMHPDFVGRENYIDQLRETLIKKHISTTVPVAVLWGEGGIGKSEIAITFANQHLKNFDLIYWMNSDTEESYISSYRHLATKLNIPFEQQESISNLVRKVHDFLENKNHFSWLIIYDNAETEYELPQRGNGAIIVTTRNHIAWHLYPCFEVTSFIESESLALLKKITLKEQTPSQLALIKELENYPLSLNLAAHYIAETPWMSEKSYIDLLSQNKVGLLSVMPTDRRYPKGLLNSWTITADQLYENHPKTLDWLHFCSYLYPDLIPSSWIEEWLMLFSKDALVCSSLKMEVNEILRLVINQALVRCDKSRKTLSLHRLKQGIFKHDKYFDPQIQEKVLQFLIHSLEDFERVDEMERYPQLWPKLRQWELHAAWFLDRHADPFPKEEIALLNSLLSSWKTIKGEHELAETYIEKALEIRLELFGKEDIRTIIAMNNKAWILMKLRKWEESKILYQQALHSLKNIVNDEHPYLAFIMNNLALVLRESHDYELAKEYNEKALVMRIKIYGKEHTYSADSMHNLGSIHRKLEEYDQAQNYLEQALHCYMSFYGKDHPYVAMTMHNLAVTFMSRGEYKQAEKYFEQAINIYIKLYGKAHPYTAHCLQNIGQLQQRLGQIKKSLNTYKKAIFNLRKIYTKGHPSILSILEDLKRLSEDCENPSILKEIEFLIKDNSNI